MPSKAKCCSLAHERGVFVYVSVERISEETWCVLKSSWCTYEHQRWHLLNGKRLLSSCCVSIVLTSRMLTRLRWNTSCELIPLVQMYPTLHSCLFQNVTIFSNWRTTLEQEKVFCDTKWTKTKGGGAGKSPPPIPVEIGSLERNRQQDLPLILKLDTDGDCCTTEAASLQKLRPSASCLCSFSTTWRELL